MAMTCHLLPFGSDDGPTNMALDEALLDAVADDPSAAVLRTYGWSVPTLSLGYFQRIAEAEADPRWRGVARVRRPTGGGALWHDRELTYALVIPGSHPLARRPADLYRAVHGAIAGAIRAAGAPADRRGEAGERIADDRPFLCFTGRDPEDIVTRDFKVVGSAQRRRRGAVLQHGSLLLRHSETTPELPGLGDLAGTPTAILDWSERLRRAIPAALALEGRERPISPEEQRSLDFRRRTYLDPDWTSRL